jgi:hypothetical protein
MALTFQRENQLEPWLRPFVSSALMPGYRRVLIEQTRLFWIAYWDLMVKVGFTDGQIADYALYCKHEILGGLPDEIAMADAVFDLARHHGLTVWPEFRQYERAPHEIVRGRLP